MPGSPGLHRAASTAVSAYAARSMPGQAPGGYISMGGRWSSQPADHVHLRRLAYVGFRPIPDFSLALSCRRLVARHPSFRVSDRGCQRIRLAARRSSPRPCSPVVAPPRHRAPRPLSIRQAAGSASLNSLRSSCTPTGEASFWETAIPQDRTAHLRQHPPRFAPLQSGLRRIDLMAFCRSQSSGGSASVMRMTAERTTLNGEDLAAPPRGSSSTRAATPRSTRRCCMHCTPRPTCCR